MIYRMKCFLGNNLKNCVRTADSPDCAFGGEVERSRKDGCSNYDGGKVSQQIGHFLFSIQLGVTNGLIYITSLH